MSIQASRSQRRELARQNAKLPKELQLVTLDRWPEGLAGRPNAPSAVWRSRDYLVQLYRCPPPAMARLSVLRTTLQGDRWQDGISWDDLQRLKAEVGLADVWAVELFPAEADVVNVANIRHLWLLPEAPAYGWREGNPT